MVHHAAAPDNASSHERGARTTLDALRRGQTAVIVDLAHAPADTPPTDRTSALALGGHRLAVGDRVTVRRGGDPMLLLFADRAGRSIRVGLCARTAAGVLVETDTAHSTPVGP